MRIGGYKGAEGTPNSRVASAPASNACILRRFFGDTTDAALRTFQASEKSCIETGVTDAATWKALVGAKRFAKGPTVLAALVDDSRDMTQQGVYLLGEDRWESVPRKK